MLSSNISRILKFKVVLNTPFHSPDKIRLEIKVYIQMKYTGSVYKFILTLDDIDNNYWSIMNLIYDNFRKDFVITDNQAYFRIASNWAGPYYNSCTIILHSDSISCYENYPIKPYSICRFDLDFGNAIKENINSLVNGLTRKHLTILMVGIMQRLNKHSIPVEIINIIFRLCKIPVSNLQFSKSTKIIIFFCLSH